MFSGTQVQKIPEIPNPTHMYKTATLWSTAIHTISTCLRLVHSQMVHITYIVRINWNCGNNLNFYLFISCWCRRNRMLDITEYTFKRKQEEINIKIRLPITLPPLYETQHHHLKDTVPWTLYRVIQRMTFMNWVQKNSTPWHEVNYYVVWRSLTYTFSYDAFVWLS